MLFLCIFLTAMSGLTVKPPGKKFVLIAGGLLSAFYLTLIVLYYV